MLGLESLIAVGVSLLRSQADSSEIIVLPAGKCHADQQQHQLEGFEVTKTNFGGLEPPNLKSKP